MALLLQPLAAPVDAWLAALQPLLPNLDIRVWPDVGPAEEVEFAAVARLPDGTLARLPRLKLICTLLAGQDILLSDPALPDVPIARVDGPEGDETMCETVLMHVLRHHCQLPQYAMQQARGVWQRLPQKTKRDTRVGFLGLGMFGRVAAQRVAAEGFYVLGWSRTSKHMDGVRSHTGRDGLMRMIASTDILVNLLQLTPETKGILDREALSALPRGASLINLARGAHLPSADLYWALDEGILGAATLDVFEDEPPPPEARVWSDPRITLTPHVARFAYDVAGAARRIAAAVTDIRAGHVPAHLLDVCRGY